MYMFVSFPTLILCSSIPLDLYHITSLLEKFIGYREEYKGVYTTILFLCVFMFVNVCFLFT